MKQLRARDYLIAISVGVSGRPGVNQFYGRMDHFTVQRTAPAPDNLPNPAGHRRPNNISERTKLLNP